MGANIVVFVLSFINNKLIYIFLSEADNGVFFLVMRSTLFLALFSGDWLRLSSMNIAGKDKSLIPVLSANGFWYSVSLGILFTVTALIVSSVFNGTVFGEFQGVYTVPERRGCSRNSALFAYCSRG